MIKEQEHAIKTLEEFIDFFQFLIKQADKANDESFDFTQAEDDIITFGIAIQAIKDLDKMNGIALDLASENDDLIEKLDAIRAEIEALPKTYPFINHIDTYVKEDDVKKIIDKHTAESEDEEQIKVGTKVRTIKDKDFAGEEVFPVGTIGIVEEIREDERLPYIIRANHDYWYYSRDMFEVIEDIEPQESEE